MSLKNFGKAALIVAVVAACGKNRVQVTDNGLKYQIHEQTDGARKGKVGDILTLHLTLKNSKDSVLRDTHKEPAPFSNAPSGSAFKGALEEGLTLLSKGDSATFYVSADSLFTRAMQPFPPGVQKGTDISITVKMLDIQSEEEYKTAQTKDAEKQKGIDAKTIADYLAKNGLTGKFKKTPGGVYYVVTQPSAGPSPKAGDLVDVHYAGRLLNGKEFDNSRTNPASGGKPLQLQLGMGMVIPGWEDGILQLHKGEKATLIIPSGLAYGPRANQAIPANSVLVFDIDLVDIKKGQAQQPPTMPQP